MLSKRGREMEMEMETVEEVHLVSFKPAIATHP